MSAAPTSERVLVVEDDASLRRILVEVLEAHGYEVTASPNVLHAIGVLGSTPVDLVVSDLVMPATRGEVLLAQVRAAFPHVPVVVMTAFGSVQGAVELVRSGAADYLTKPFGTEHFLKTIARVLNSTRPQRETARARQAPRSHFEGLVGRSRSMRELFERIERIAQSRAPVLITGETGTGKELIATALHRASGRDPFVPLNCAAIPPQLLESELFGHARGAYTGAERDKAGLFEIAHGGTLFLDEIGEMPLALQPKLLRVLQEGTLRRVGEVEERSVEVRIVAATHRDPATELREGRLRQDLFFRLNVLRLQLPPLRERASDIPLLAERFLAHIARREGWDEIRVAPDALGALVGYAWPGNVRELQNAVERAAMFAEKREIRLRDLPEEIHRTPTAPDFVAAAAERMLSLAEMEQEYIAEVLRRTGGNKKRAAELLGIPRRSLYRMLERDGAGKGEGAG